MAGNPLLAAGAEQIDLDLSLALRVAEDVAAGEDQGLAAAGVDDRAGAARMARRVFHPQSHAGRQ